tara:strand:- start:422 stop:655 length:234 start_codon:yes stop_codon:yes gene_type:complete
MNFNKYLKKFHKINFIIVLILILVSLYLIYNQFKLIEGKDLKDRTEEEAKDESRAQFDCITEVGEQAEKDAAKNGYI